MAAQRPLRTVRPRVRRSSDRSAVRAEYHAGRPRLRCALLALVLPTIGRP